MRIKILKRKRHSLNQLPCIPSIFYHTRRFILPKKNLMGFFKQFDEEIVILHEGTERRPSGVWTAAPWNL